MMRGNSSRPVRIRGAAPRYQSEGFRVKFNDLFSSADGYNAGRHPEAFKDEKFKVRGLVPSTNDGGVTDATSRIIRNETDREETCQGVNWTGGGEKRVMLVSAPRSFVARLQLLRQRKHRNISHANRSVVIAVG